MTQVFSEPECSFSQTKDPSPPLEDDANRSTKKVKIREEVHGKEEDVQDVSMEDPANLSQVDGRPSFKDQLLQNGSKDKEYDQPEVSIELVSEDVVIGDEGDMPTIHFSERVKDLLSQSMDKTVIVKLLGRSMGFKALQNKIVALWKPNRDFQIVDLDNGYFIVKFDDRDDYLHSLLHGPWTVFGNYLTVQPWSPCFTVEENFPSPAVVWVRFPGLPLQYYHKATLRSISNLVGKLVKIDYNTEVSKRGKFARVAVKVDLTKPLLARFKLEGQIQRVEYEDLPLICYHCGKFGHVKENCSQYRAPSTDNQSSMEVEDPIKQSELPQENFPATGQNLGPWMQVQHRGRSKYGRGGCNATNGGRGMGSRFNVLSEWDPTDDAKNPETENDSPDLRNQFKEHSIDDEHVELNKVNDSLCNQTDKAHNAMLNKNTSRVFSKKQKGREAVIISEQTQDTNGPVSNRVRFEYPLRQASPINIDSNKNVVNNKDTLLDPSKHSVVVFEPISNKKKQRNKTIPLEEGVSLVYRTGGKLGRPPDKGVSLNIRGRREIGKKSIAKNSKNLPKDFVREEDLVTQNDEEDYRRDRGRNAQPT